MNRTRLLLVDDDDTFAGLLARELSERGMQVATAGDAVTAGQRIDQQEFDVALVDLKLPDGNGLEILRQIRERQPRMEVVVLTGHGTIDTAIEAIRLGAFDYLRKPCPVEELEVAIQKALERQALVERNTILRDGFAPPDLAAEFVGASPGFHEMCQLIDRLAATDSTVLIQGETGVGKGIVANLIHARSARATQPMVVVECAALHEQLLDSELFGHEKGAYTGAIKSKHGLFEVADRGTVFLDEIGEVSLATQVKLLGVLETGRFRHLGGTKEIAVDVRVIAATNRDLREMMRRGFFREDLFFRLNTIRIEVPSLRSRKQDVLLLAEHFLRRLNERFAQKKRLSAAAEQRLVAYRWPGNVRELLHAVERAVVLSDGENIYVEHLPEEIRAQHARPGGQTGDQELLPLHEIEKMYIIRVLGSVEGNRSRAAKILGISERTLYRKLRSYGLDQADET